MTTIADFRPSISDLNEDEVLTLIRDIRALRRQMPEKKASKSKKSAKKAPKKKSVKTYVEDLNSEEKKALLQRLLKLKGAKDV